MSDILLTRQLSGRGYGPDEVARLERRGGLVRVRRGAYVQTVDGASPAVLDPDGLALRHRHLVLATMAQLHPRAVVSHGSAGVLHGLPVFPALLQHVHITRDRPGGGVRRAVVQVHGTSLLDAEVTSLEGLPVTSLARTVADLARVARFDQAVAIGDRALALDLNPGELSDVLDRAGRRQGAPQARRVAAFLDARSESVGESFSRVRFHEHGVPPPVPQFEVTDPYGRLVGRTDFGWPELGTVGEFDGKIKYGRLLAPGEKAEEVIYREKIREDALRDQGWQVVRWTWSDLGTPAVLAGRLRRAFDRGTR